MKRLLSNATCGLAIIAASAVTALPALAGKPSWAGGGNGGDGHRYKESRKDERGERHFDDQRHQAVHDYYAAEYRGGKCPPGLAKKHNGCMPPGQAKKWRMGQPLPHDVVVYDLPPKLVVEIGLPPAGYRYVRVASDILMIAVGTNMVVDAINDLGQR